MAHTKTPWTLEEHETEPCQLIGNGTIHIADIYMTDFPAGKADAELIAAAPELLEVLRRSILWLSKMIADGAHLNAVLPGDCENTLARADELIDRLSAKGAL